MAAALSPSIIMIEECVAAVVGICLLIGERRRGSIIVFARHMPIRLREGAAISGDVFE